MKNIRPINPKFLNSPGGNSIIGVRKLNPILMGKPSIDSMEENEIPELTTGVIQEPVFFRPEPVVAPVAEVQSIVETPVMVQEEVIQSSVVNSTRPDYQTVEIAVPGMGLDNNGSISEDPTIAQAIDAQLASVAPIMEHKNVDAEVEQKLYNAAEFTAAEEAAKEIVQELPEIKEINTDYIVQNIAEIEKFKNAVAVKLASLKANVAELKTELDSLAINVESFCDEISRGDAKAKESYDTKIVAFERQRQTDNSAILSTLQSEMNNFNLGTETQDLGRVA